MTDYSAAADRYDQLTYRRTGRSGLKLPEISLGLWQNFGTEYDSFDDARAMLRRAFDAGITHFDLANNYGPPPGSAESNFGKLFKQDFLPYRDELIISTKAGYLMWPGPYGEFGSRKYLLCSLDQSLKRMGLDYVDIFYSHRPDPETPLEETMMALDQAVRSGKALYAGISNYPADMTAKATAILNELGTPCLIHQARYSMLDRWVEDGLLAQLDKDDIGFIVFSPLAQGLLSDKYLHGIPDASRATKSYGSLSKGRITPELVVTLQKLNQMAADRGQTLAQMAIAWLLRRPRVTSVLIGASSTAQIDDCIGGTKNTAFTNDELTLIDDILA